MVSTSQIPLSQRLSESGLRSTPQRAEEVFVRAKAQQQNISLATVYNCLEALVEYGLVKQVNFERQPSRYCPNLHEHGHLHDDATGQITDVPMPSEVSDRLRSLVPEGYKVIAVDLTFRVRKD
jgi:Fur family transcriptional regulator, peroxide stress response regulator